MHPENKLKFRVGNFPADCKEEGAVPTDSGESGAKRLMVFATSGSIELLEECPEWFLDRSFRVCPLTFEQLYTVHVKPDDGKVVPALYALLPGRDRDAYRRLVDVIERAVDGIHPQGLHVDFENVMIKDLERAFPSAGCMVCNFHLNQCLYRHIQKDEKLHAKYLGSLDSALKLKRFAASMCVPVEDVRSSFEMLAKSQFVVMHGSFSGSS